VPEDTQENDFGQANPWKHIFGTRTAVAWMAMMAIMTVLLGVILFLIKRKDVV
jgi:hypothetical protein